MTVEKRIASAFGLDDEGWARHANPWSGWTRVITTLPLLVAAIWSRAWLGYWSLIAIGVALWWITGAKLWYIDRMAILYDDMFSAQPDLRYLGSDPNSD